MGTVPFRRVAEGVYLRGSVYYVIFGHRGRFVRERLSVSTLAAAKSIRDGMRANFDRQLTGQEQVATAQSVSACIDARLANREGKIAASTQTRYRECRGHLVRFLGPLDVRVLQPRDITGYQSARTREGASAKTVNHELQLLHSAIMSTNAPDVFRHAEFRDGWKLPEREVDDYARFFTDDEIRRMLDAAGASWFRRFIITAMWTTARAGELASVRLADVDTVRGLVTFRAAAVKGRRGRRKPRTVPLSRDALAAVREQVAAAKAIRSPYLFPAPRDAQSPMRPETVTEAWTQARKRAKVEGRLHDLRHTGISRLVSAGIDSRIIREISGHTTTRMIDSVYGHVRSTDVAAAVRKTESVFHSSFTAPFSADFAIERNGLEIKQ